MKIVKILSVVAAALFMYGCEKAGQDPTLDVRPGTYINITNAAIFRPDPVITTSLQAGGKFEISIAVPAGKTIKEITRIGTGPSPSIMLSTAATGWYVGTPIPVNGSTYTLSTSVAEYFIKNPISKDNAAALADNELSYRFYFLVTMSDNSQEISMPVRILILK